MKRVVYAFQEYTSNDAEGAVLCCCLGEGLRTSAREGVRGKR